MTITLERVLNVLTKDDRLNILVQLYVKLEESDSYTVDMRKSLVQMALNDFGCEFANDERMILFYNEAARFSKSKPYTAVMREIYNTKNIKTVTFFAIWIFELLESGADRSQVAEVYTEAHNNLSFSDAELLMCKNKREWLNYLARNRGSIGSDGFSFETRLMVNQLKNFGDTLPPPSAQTTDSHHSSAGQFDDFCNLVGTTSTPLPPESLPVAEANVAGDSPDSETSLNTVVEVRNMSTDESLIVPNDQSFCDIIDVEEMVVDLEASNRREKPSLPIHRDRTVPPVGFSPNWGGPTMCLSCSEVFDLPDGTTKFADHLLVTHKIVVKEIELIVDPKRYIEHWRQRFAKESIEKIFPKLVPVEGDAYHGNVDYYYQLSEQIPEDYSLRQRLAMRRLEEALICQQRERDEVSFSMQCIFCRHVARGNRAKLIDHLYKSHDWKFGPLDDLVFVHEYLEHLRNKLLLNECLYCEEAFSDRKALIDHMIKLDHHKVNPNNGDYGKFYISQYLEWEKQRLIRKGNDDALSLSDSTDEEEEEDLEWHEWQEDKTDKDELCAICLFCDESHDKVAPFLDHLNDRHKFDLIGYIEKEKLDTYGRMKLINHLRKEIFNTPNFRAKVQTADDVVEIPAREKWDTEEDLVPMFANDHLLWMLESYLDENRPELAGHEVTVANDAPVVDRLIAESKANTINGVVPDDLPLFYGNEPEKEELRELARAIRSGPSFD